MLFLKLLLAHILGDFVLQSNFLVEKRKHNVMYLFLHVIIHAAVLCLIFVDQLPQYYILLSFIVVSHLAIDSLKIWVEKKWNCNQAVLFVVDQFLHITILVAIVFAKYGIPYDLLQQLLTVKSLLYLIAFLLTAVVSPVFLKVVFSKWNQQNEFALKKSETLGNAGLWIGVMERLIIVLFIQVGFLSGIGFLLAAKSIFRFGDLTKAKDTKFTEYILVGTLASFLIAITIGYILRLGLKLT